VRGIRLMSWSDDLLGNPLGRSTVQTRAPGRNDPGPSPRPPRDMTLLRVESDVRLPRCRHAARDASSRARLPPER